MTPLAFLDYVVQLDREWKLVMGLWRLYALGWVTGILVAFLMWAIWNASGLDERRSRTKDRHED